MNGLRERMHMNDLAGFGFWLFSGLVASVVVVAVFWSRTRQQQMRNEVILKLLETGKSLDPETLDKLLAQPGAASTTKPAEVSDPRAAYRQGNGVFFFIGFATLFYAFARDAGPSYALLALGMSAVVLAFIGWSVGDKQFRDGTLPTLKYKRDPRESYLNASFVFFLIGYGTVFIGITRAAGISYPIVGLGVLPILMCFNGWRQANKEYREGKLTGTPLERDPE
jgi:hypothetical protein